MSSCVNAARQLLAFYFELEITSLVGWNGLRMEAGSATNVLKQVDVVAPPTNGGQKLCLVSRTWFTICMLSGDTFGVQVFRCSSRYDEEMPHIIALVKNVPKAYEDHLNSFQDF